MRGEQHRLFDDVLRSLSLALDFDDGRKLFHAWRVGLLSLRIGRILELPEAGLLYYAGLLHDIGGIGLPDHVVHAARTGFDSPQVRAHASDGARIIRPFCLLAPVEPFIADHHERFDGRGFPAGKRGDEIAPGAYVVAVADCLELTRRNLGEADPMRDALHLLHSQRDAGWPAAVADAAIALLEREPELFEALWDGERLEGAIRGVDCAPDGLDRISVVELLSQLLWVFARVIDAKHRHTLGHSMRVTRIAHRIAHELRGDEINDWDVVWAGLLHDVGKVGVPRAVLEKGSALSGEELAQVKRHAQDTESIIASIHDLAYLARSAAAHHEAYDGSGYPRGLCGEDIPLLGRILAYADFYDALRHDQSTGRAVGHDEAMAQIRRGVGTLFDPHFADVAQSVLDELARTPGPAGDAQQLSELLDTDTADLRRVLGGRTSTGAVAKLGARGALLIEGEPWRALELSAQLEIRQGRSELAAFLGLPASASFPDYIDSDGRARLAQWNRPGGEAVVSSYLFTPRGTPLEVALVRRGEGWTLLYRSAESRMQNIKRLSLFYRNFLSSTEAAVFTDLAGKVVDVNRTFLDLYGYQLRDLVGVPPPILTPDGAGAAPFFDLLKLAATTGGFWHGEQVTYTRDRREVPVLFTLVTVRDTSGALMGYIARAVDISERKRLERELAEKNQALEALSRLKSDLMAITSHDLKSPVAGMMSYARLAQSQLAEGRAERVAGYMDRILALGGDMLRLVGDLLDLEKIDSGQLRLELEALRLDEVLGSCVETHAVVARERAVAVHYRVTGRPRRVVADGSRLEQVFNNVLSNALKFSPGGSEVQVRYDDDGDRVRIEVHDRGPGIPESELERVFERYHQAKSPRSGGERHFGVGLGLAIARSIVELHAGKIWAENHAEGGCLVRIDLPALGAKAGSERATVALLAPSAELVERLGGLLRSQEMTLAQVDDEEEARRVRFAAAPAAVFFEVPWRSEEARRALAVLTEGPGPGPLQVEVRAQGAAEVGERALCAPWLDLEVLELLREARLQVSAGDGG